MTRAFSGRVVSGLAAAAVFAAAVALSSVASAAIQFTGNYTISANKSDPGLVIETKALTNPSIVDPSTQGSLNFSLNVGQTYTTDLFRIWTDETTVNAGEDTVEKPIIVAFNFTAPQSSGSTPGTTVGGRTVFGLAQRAEVDWNNPQTVNFGSGGMLQIFLTDRTFNGGLLGLNEGEAHGKNVEATFKLLSDSTSVVPLPASLPLFLVALGGLAVIRRR